MNFNYWLVAGCVLWCCCWGCGRGINHAPRAANAAFVSWAPPRSWPWALSRSFRYVLCPALLGAAHKYPAAVERGAVGCAIQLASHHVRRRGRIVPHDVTAIGWQRRSTPACHLSRPPALLQGDGGGTDHASWATSTVWEPLHILQTCQANGSLFHLATLPSRQAS